MRPNSAVSPILAVTVLLAACGTQPLAPTVAPTAAVTPDVTAPTTTTSAPNTPTVAPTVTAPQDPTELAIATAVAKASLPDAAYDDAAHARLRVSNCVFGGPRVDVFLNGAVAKNGEAPLANLGALDVSGYLYLAPDTYRVAIVPTGQDSTKALLGPLDVPVKAGHRYTLAMLGQLDDAHRMPLLVDETAAYLAIGATAAGDAHISINNIKGVDALDFAEGGIVRDENVPYGGFKAGIWPVENFKKLAITVSGQPDQVIGSGDDGYNTPGTDSLDCFGGAFPGTSDTHTAASMSSLSVIEFLDGFSGKNLIVEGSLLSFDTLLGAIKTAGLTDLYTSGGPLLFLAPTDEAFTRVPKAQREALLADPAALARLLRTLTVNQYVPRGIADGAFDDPTPITLRTLDGGVLGMSYTGQGLSVNGYLVGHFETDYLANGTRIHPINQVLLR